MSLQHIWESQNQFFMVFPFLKKYPLVATMIGGACGGLYAGLTQTHRFATGSSGLPAILLYLGNNTTKCFINIIIAIVISAVVSGVLTFILSYKFENKAVEAEDTTEEKEEVKEIEIAGNIDFASPVKGKVLPLSDAKDEVFASGALGKGMSIQDLHAPEHIADFKVASDHYHHWKEDVALMAEMGLKAYRFSISWARIFPDGEGEVNEAGVRFYDQLIDELVKNNIEPVVTMYHFDLPLELYKKGGWNNRETIDAFEKYSKILFENYGDRVKYWITINEQNCMINHPNAMNPGKVPSKKELYQQCHNMFVAGAKATLLCHEMCKDAKIGPAPNITAIYPETCAPSDVIAADNWETIRCWMYLDMAVYGKYNALAWAYMEEKDCLPQIEEGDMELLASAKADFIGVNYYATATVSASKNDGTDCQPRNGDQQVMLGEEGVYRAAQNPNLEETEFG